MLRNPVIPGKIEVPSSLVDFPFTPNEKEYIGARFEEDGRFCLRTGQKGVHYRRITIAK